MFQGIAQTARPICTQWRHWLHMCSGGRFTCCSASLSLPWIPLTLMCCCYYESNSSDHHVDSAVQCSLTDSSVKHGFTEFLDKRRIVCLSRKKRVFCIQWLRKACGVEGDKSILEQEHPESYMYTCAIPRPMKDQCVVFIMSPRISVCVCVRLQM